MELLKLFMSQNTLSFIFALVTLVVVVSVFVMIFRRRHTVRLHSISPFIESIPFLAGLIPAAGLLTMIHSISYALSFHGGADPKVVAAGFQEFFFILTVTGGLFFVFLEVWLVIRMFFGKYIRELDAQPR